MKGNLNEYLALSLALSCITRKSSSSSSGVGGGGGGELNKTITKLNNPYLKALFSYQIDRENFDYQIYNDYNILIPDRVCMALNVLKIEQVSNWFVLN